MCITTHKSDFWMVLHNSLYILWYYLMTATIIRWCDALATTIFSHSIFHHQSLFGNIQVFSVRLMDIRNLRENIRANITLSMEIFIYGIETDWKWLTATDVGLNLQSRGEITVFWEMHSVLNRTFLVKSDWSWLKSTDGNWNALSRAVNTVLYS
jgi:hypothetical protein